jgi:hypothetical protein
MAPTQYRYRYRVTQSGRRQLFTLFEDALLRAEALPPDVPVTIEESPDRGLTWRLMMTRGSIQSKLAMRAAA